MTVEIFSVLDYYGNKNNGEDVLALYLKHYRNNFPNSIINIYLSNYPDNYEGKEISLLKSYNCNIKKIVLDKTEKYFDYRLTKEVRNYLKKEKEFKNSVWKSSTSDWIVLCDIDEILMISEQQLQKETCDVITFKGYSMIRYNKNSKVNQLTYGIQNLIYSKSCIFKSTVEDMNFDIGQHECNPTTSNISVDKYKLLHYNKKDYDISPFNKIELVRTDIKKEVEDNYIMKKLFISNLFVADNIKPKPIDINSKGAWVDKRLEDHHYTDYQLCEKMLEFLRKEKSISLADFGCGLGEYVEYFRNNGILADGYDGNPKTNTYSKYCSVLDLSKEVKLKKYDWVMSFEVGEHIPLEYMDSFINNIHKTNIKGVIITWAPPGQPGFGHINCQDTDFIIQRFEKLGYTFDNVTTEELCDSCELPWLPLSLSVLRKNKQHDS